MSGDITLPKSTKNINIIIDDDDNNITNNTTNNNNDNDNVFMGRLKSYRNEGLSPTKGTREIKTARLRLCHPF